MDLPIGPDGHMRCWWAEDSPALRDYHDQEWGRPVHDELALFEKLCLEGFQAGLSWRTILDKRPAFRSAFAGFDPERLAGFGDDEVAALLTDTRIVRHRGKIEAAIGNAQRYLELVVEEGSLAGFVWRFAEPDAPAPRSRDEVRTCSPASRAMADALRRRRWRFIGPTTAYAFQQAMGLVNDHLIGCAFRQD